MDFLAVALGATSSVARHNAVMVKSFADLKVESLVVWQKNPDRDTAIKGCDYSGSINLKVGDELRENAVLFCSADLEAIFDELYFVKYSEEKRTVNNKLAKDNLDILVEKNYAIFLFDAYDEEKKAYPYHKKGEDAGKRIPFNWVIAHKDTYAVGGVTPKFAEDKSLLNPVEIIKVDSVSNTTKESLGL